MELAGGDRESDEQKAARAEAVTFVSPERQNELTRRVQARLAKAAKEVQKQNRAAKKQPTPATPAAQTPPAAPAAIENLPPASRLVQ